MARNGKNRGRRRKPKPQLVPYGAPDLLATRQRVVDLIVQHAVEMVDATIDAAKDGQYAAMRCLFEMAGIFSLPDERAVPKDDALTETLLQRLGLLDSLAAGSSIRKDSQSEAKPG